MNINPAEVERIFFSCLFTDEELIDGKPSVDPVIVEGIKSTFGFHPTRLDAERGNLLSLLEQLPVEFEQGSSFLNMCSTKTGDLWTGSHATCEQLIAMAIGLGLASYTCKKDDWDMLPGGVPYISFQTKTV